MKTSVLLLLAVFITTIAFGQNFEGKIVYTNSYKSKSPTVSDAQWNAMLGTKQEYFIKSGDYKSILNGSLVQWQLYNNKDNKLYNKVANSETIYWNDGSEYKDSVLDYKVNKGVTKILGNKCDELILTCKSSIQKYYFSSNYKINSKLFINHKFGNWYDYLSKSNAVPLKVVMEMDQFVLESTATEIIPQNIDSSMFELPINTKTEKSPY